MSMDVGGSKGGVKSDINVTPLVDVMLVLLIIMMIVAPLLQKGADVKLPLAANTAEKPETQDQTVLAVDKSDRYYKRCSELQKRLGTFNDLVTLQRLAEDLSAERLDLAPALGMLENRSQPMVAQALQRIDKPVARMARENPFW